MNENAPDTLFGIPADVMGQNPPPVEIPFPTESAAPVVAEMDPAEEAAMKFTKLLPFISKLATALPSKGGAVRVLHALAEFPLGATKPRFLNAAERQLFQVMMELQGYKSTVVTSIMKKNAEVQTEAEELKQTAEAIAPTAEMEVQNG